jgi:NAD(P)-dependent dehydrogenase (short-subunit alcohol dehydrogenase family)/acyl carrier protein
VQSVLLAVVSDKTGYPPEMLDPDMGLDADLGIDSIKRVEILSALQEQLPDAPAVKPEHLGTLHTLRQIVEFLCASEPGASATAASPSPVAHVPGAPPALSGERVMAVLLAVVADKTGYPPEMLDPDMGLDADLGIDSIKRVEILSALQEQLPDAPAVKPEHLGTLHTLRQIAEFLTAGSSPPPVAVAPAVAPGPPYPVPSTSSLQRLALRLAPLKGADRPPVSIAAGADLWLVGNAVPLAAHVHEQLAGRGLHVRTFGWTDPLPQCPPALAGLVLIAPSEKADGVPHAAFRWLQAAGPALRAARGAVVATVTQLDGAFGLSDRGPQGDPVCGALAGLVKTARHEWPEVACKALDVDPALDPVAAAEVVVDELFLAGPVEVGIAPDGRHTLDPVPVTVPATDPPFGPQDVVVITGGARGVTAEVAVALAEECRPTLVLLGRSPEPAAEPADLAACADETSLKRALAARAGGTATPRQLDEQCKALLAGREIRRTLDRLTATGTRVLYRAVDVRDAAAVAGVLADVRRTAGPITGLIHGAGVLADRRIEDQTAEQFDTVYSTKVGGLRALLAATAGDPLKVIALFSSSTGRFGRTGQAAYAAANEALNKLAQAEARRRAGCRVVAVNWGPWEGGMVTPALRSVFAAEGIGLIPLAAGARYLLAEMSAPDRAIEVVVLGEGKLPDPSPSRPVADDAPLALAFERELDLDRYPVLRAHVIDGRAVLPMALTVEWLAHAAIHGNPGLQFAGLDGLKIFAPVTVRDGHTTPVSVYASKAVRADGLHRVTAELRSRRADGREMIHSRADVLLATELPRGGPVQPEPALPPYPLDPDDVYQRVLFHGPELRGLEQIAGCGPAGVVVTAQAAPSPAAWVQQPQRGTWLADPLVLDCAFQALSVWCHAQRGAVSLPSALGCYRQFRRRFPAGAVRVVCRVIPAAGQVVRADVDFVDDAGQMVARIDGCECVLDQALNAAFRRNRLEAAKM